MTCDVITQGYGGPVQHTVKCLPHTGQSLWPFLVAAVVIVALGFVFWLVAGRAPR